MRRTWCAAGGNSKGSGSPNANRVRRGNSGGSGDRKCKAACSGDASGGRCRDLEECAISSYSAGGCDDTHLLNPLFLTSSLTILVYKTEGALPDNFDVKALLSFEGAGPLVSFLPRGSCSSLVPPALRGLAQFKRCAQSSCRSCEPQATFIRWVASSAASRLKSLVRV